MSLINDQQKKNAGVEENNPISIPKPAKPTTSEPPAPEPLEPIQSAPIEAFENAVRQDISSEPSVNQPPVDNTNRINIAEAIRPGSSDEPIAPPPAPTNNQLVPIAPQIDLWQDVTAGDGGRIRINTRQNVATKKPTLFNPLRFDNAAGEAVNQQFTQVGNRYLTEQQRQEQERVSRASEIEAQRRTKLKNTADVERPWHETAADGIGDFFSVGLFGSKEAQRRAEKENEFNPLVGQFAKHGSGFGGFLKYSLSIPAALVPFAYSEVAEELVQQHEDILRKENLQFEYNGKKLNYNQLPKTEQRRIANDRFNARIGSVLPGYYGYEGRNTLNALSDILTGKVVGDDTNDANPFLEPFEGATAERPKGSLFATGRRPGQSWRTDGSWTWELANILLSPGNKFDIVGDAIGTVVGKAGGTVFKGVDNLVFGGRFAKRSFARQADELLQATRPPDTRGRPGVLVPDAGSPITPVKEPLKALPPGRQSVPANKLTPDGLKLQEGVNLPKAEPTPPAAQPIKLPAVKTEDIFSDSAVDFSESIGKRTVEFKAPNAPEVDAFADEFAGNFNHGAVYPDLIKKKPVIPGKGVAEVIEEVGVMQPGRTLEFSPAVMPRNHDDVISFLRTGTAEQKAFVEGYTGRSWEEFQEWTARKGNEVTSIGGVIDGVQVTKPTLDDLITQARELAANKNVFARNAEVIQKYFDETIDVGRRAIDELPVEKTSADEVLKTLEAGNKLKLLPAAEETLEETARVAVRENNAPVIAETLSNEAIETAVKAHNDSLEPIQRVTKYTKQSTIKPPAEVIHGTAVKDWSPDYNVIEFGSRGELGAGLYSTADIDEAQLYARALVGENVSSNARYAEIEPSVNILDTSAFKSTLDASSSSRVPRAVVNELRQRFPNIPLESKNYTYKNLVADIERGVAKTNPSEKGLQQANRTISDVLRNQGYDSIYDKRSKWFVALDNQKLKTKRKIAVPMSETPLEATRARFNVDTMAAKKFPKHITSASNLADSSYKLNEQVSALVDDKLIEVQNEAIQRIVHEVPEPVVKVEKLTKAKAVIKNSTGKNTVESATALLKQFGNAIELPVVTKRGEGSWTISSNNHTLEAARQLRKRRLDVVVKQADGKTTIESIPLDEFKDVSVKAVSDELPTKNELFKQAKEGRLEQPPVYEKNASGALIPAEGFDDASEAAKSVGEAYQAVVIDKGTAKVATVDGDDVIFRPRQKKPPKVKKTKKAKAAAKKADELLEARDVKAKKGEAPVKEDTQILKELEKAEVKKLERGSDKIDDFVDDLPDEFDEIDDVIPTDEELMRIDEDFFEDAPFNPDESMDDLFSTMDDFTICRF